MEAFRIRLLLEGPYGTPLTSGPSGQMCWALVRQRGEPALREDWLPAAREGHVLVSDALPENLLPRPLLAPAPLGPGADMARHKEQKRRAWVRREAFLAGRHRLDNAALTRALNDHGEDREARAAHNTIDRQRGTTLESGGLHLVDEWWPKDEARWRDLYVRTDRPLGEIVDLLKAVGGWGYGRDSTYGRGRFAVEGAVRERELLAGTGSRWLSLSHGAWSEGVAEPRWKLWTHFGKVGQEATARGGRPWKRPVILLRPGATWAAAGDGPFGAWIEDGLYQDAEWLGFRPELNAWHLAVPFKEAGDGGWSSGG